MNKKKKILHIVPTEYGGGVETAAKSFLKHSCKKYTFKVFFLQKRREENIILAYLDSFQRIQKICPDIIITSLWKSNLITLLYKSINIKTKYILFLHSTKNKHFIDGIFTSFTALFAHEIWADSQETFLERINSLYFLKSLKNQIIKKKEKRIISFILKKVKPLNQLKCSPSFIYWGRLCPYKNIDKAINLFSKVYEVNKKATFKIIGPDFGAKKFLQKKIIKMELENNVLIFGDMNFEQIKNYAEKSSFFIQLSSYEGMAMSVCESMQLGLIPLVTNVGQIKKYCKNLDNCFIYKNNDDEILSNIFRLLNSEHEYLKIRKDIIETWYSYPTYEKDMISAIQNLI